MKRTTQELYVGLGMMAVGLLGVFVAVPTGIDLPSSVEFQALSPDFWPKIILGSLVACGAATALQAFLADKKPADAPTVDALENTDGENEPGAIEFDFGARLVRVVLVLVGLFTAYAAIPYLGMVATAIVVILVMTFTLGERRLKYVLPLAFVLPALLYFFFVYVASIPMPLGFFETYL